MRNIRLLVSGYTSFFLSFFIEVSCACVFVCCIYMCGGGERERGREKEKMKNSDLPSRES